MIRLLSRVLFTVLWIPVVAMSQTAAPATAAGKIVWLNLDAAINSCDEGKNEIAEIQKYVDDKTAEMNAMRKEFDTLNNQLSVQGSKLTDEARADLEYQISDKKTALQRFQEDTQKDINNKRDRMFGYVGKRLQLVMDKVAREKGLAAILIMNPNRDAYIDPTLDITDEMVKAYNATYPASKAKPSAPPAVEQ